MLSFLCVPLAGLAITLYLRWAGLSWTWALGGLILAWPLKPVAIACGLAVVAGARWHRADLADGGDLAQVAASRRGPLDVLRASLDRRRPLVDGDGLSVGVDAGGASVRIPIGRRSGTHTLIVGATGSGKTVTEAWIVAQAVGHGHGAVIVDPKGDDLLRGEARAAALRAGRPFIEWTPTGPTIYNPYAHGSTSEIVDKALAAEPYTEPHYLRQAQRYLAHAVRTLHAAGETASPARMVELMDPRALEVLSRRLADVEQARLAWRYLDGLDPRQRAGLSGTRDRLAILAESEIGPWLDPAGPAAGAPVLDLLEAVRWRAVVYFRLDADRLPLVARMLAAAIVQDLLTVAAALQGDPMPTLVAVDEFSAIAPDGVARLFGRGRSAGFSLLLATQELADLEAGSTGSSAGGSTALLEQVLGNLATLIAHRQGVPESADLIASIGGTRPVWQTSQTTSGYAGTARGTRSRSREYLIHPNAIKTLPTGTAAVIVAGSGRASLARIFHP
ncbi:MAG: type IV secretion system DNA-binding domain-containing protein [Actinobacteria bacterium]|nr:type IV secretion system DNA-binding domain-containing protein [Actinomycetota bacterium]